MRWGVEDATAEALRERAGSGPARECRSRQSSAARGVRLALAGGGTGGHILPGMRVAARACEAGALEDLVWFQTGRSVEEPAMAGFEERLGGATFERCLLKLEPSGGGAPSAGTLALHTPLAVGRARSALRRHEAQVLLGLGGYVCLPVVLAARSLRIPVALLEINAKEGKATRWLAAQARRVFHAWPGTLPAQDSAGGWPRDLWTGPPLCAAFEAAAPPAEGEASARSDLGFSSERPLLVVMGGSQGARGLNRFVAAHAGVLLERGVQVLHQTGPGRLAEAGAAAAGYRAVEFVVDVPLALRAATMVLCRGGASTLAEIGALRRPAWVVPYPHHPDRHQERNARQLGAGVRIVPEELLDLERARELARLCGVAGREPRAAMAAALEGRVPVDGAQRIWRELARLAHTGG